MLKISLKITENDDVINVKLLDSTKKELASATDNEKLIAQKFKDLFDTKLMELLEETNEE